jgi:hypothetical protein
MRTIKLEHSVAKFKDAKTLHDEHNFYNQWDAMEFLLAKRPEIGVSPAGGAANEDLIHVVAADELAGTKDLVVLYSYDDNFVIIHGARYA